MDCAHSPDRRVPGARLLDADDVFRRARELDPQCTFEAVARYVQEMNDVALDLEIVAYSDHFGTYAQLPLGPEGKRP